eukprot:1200116-Amphidinium_carterae.1
MLTESLCDLGLQRIYASPADESMLTPCDGQFASKRFRVDCPTALSLFSDFCYTGGTSQARLKGLGLPALDLAQYWQVHRAVNGLEHA